MGTEYGTHWKGGGVNMHIVLSRALRWPRSRCENKIKMILKEIWREGLNLLHHDID